MTKNELCTLKLLRILNLGAGVQSTAVWLLAAEGKIGAIDFAIFADTQEEPQAVYDHLEWMRTQPGPEILVRTAGRLGDNLLVGKNSTGGRFVSIPAFTGKHHDKRAGDREPCNEGMIRRQCTKEYKIEVVEKSIRRDILKLQPRQRIPKDAMIEQIFGISADESGRAKRIKRNWSDRGNQWDVSFPLIVMNWTRKDCLEYLADRVPHTVTRSACVFCPFKSATEWQRTKDNPDEWARAVEIDRALRIPGNVVNRNMDQAIYLHRSLIPLEMVDFRKEAERERQRNARPLFDPRSKMT